MMGGGGISRGTAHRANPGAAAIAIIEATKSHGTTIVVVRDMRDMREYAALLRAFDPEGSVACLPEWDCLPCDHVSPSLAVMGERAGTLRWMASTGAEPKIVLATVASLCQRVPPPETWAKVHLEIRPDDPFDPEAVAARLVHIGYVREERVDEPGQFAVHGKTFDVFPAAASWPCRIEYDGGRAAAIRSYDVATQRSLKPCEHLGIDPASEIIPANEAAERPKPFCGEEHHLARYYDRLVSVCDYLPDAPLMLNPEVEERGALFFEQVDEGCGISEGRVKGLHLSPCEWTELMAGCETIPSPPEDATESAPRFSRERRPIDRLKRYLHERRVAGEVILLTGDGRSLRALVRQVEKTTGSSVRTVEGWSEVAEAGKGDVLSMASPLRHGFRSPHARFAVVTAADLLGDDATRSRDVELVLPVGDIALEVGDVAIDRDNGLCVFEGLETLDGSDAGASEALRLRFSGGDVLMVPVEQADRVWRYSSEPDAVTLDKLGGSAWDKRRTRVEAAIARTARAMRAMAAERARMRTSPVLPDLRAMERFAADFRFSATPDQAVVIDEVLADLASESPMDRLVCGDVGYGKTEVALRAIAAAVFAGRQAAFLAPTTVLVRQHAETLQRRFSRFGIEVCQLSRLTAKAETERVRRGLADGSLQVVVGTQALAGDGVGFADLAVTVIDEEQRFGSAMKEKLRNLGGAGPGHVLTLTATPIPRTLQGALSGLHGLSLLATPPTTRQPIRTLVRPFDPTIVGEALLRERARGGQSFVVCPRIEDLEPMARRLADAGLGLDVAIAHGKLKAAEMDERIVRFAGGEGDVLLATSIIESGLDIPRANTMIVHRADQFGLAQLHQLRGRVGRGHRRGVVYLTSDAGVPLSPAAEKRLAALEKLDRLGSGFAIAGRDLDLRGAGDLVGKEQAGHVQKIGLGLYQHLLELTLAAAAGKPISDWSPEIAVGPIGRIPENFVPDADTRLVLYGQLFRARKGEEIEAWRDDLTDRFGSLPEEVERLARTARLRAACRRLGVARLFAGPEGIAADLRSSDAQTRRVVWKEPTADGDAREMLAASFLSRLGRKPPGTRAAKPASLHVKVPHEDAVRSPTRRAQRVVHTPAAAHA